MKKLITTTVLTVIAFNLLPASAAIDTERLLNEDYLRNAGYSPESIRMINIKRYDPYAPYKGPEDNRNFIKKFIHYMDPLADSGKFGQGIIQPGITGPSKLE